MSVCTLFFCQPILQLNLPPFQFLLHQSVSSLHRGKTSTAKGSAEFSQADMIAQAMGIHLDSMLHQSTSKVFLRRTTINNITACSAASSYITTNGNTILYAINSWFLSLASIHKNLSDRIQFLIINEYLVRLHPTSDYPLRLIGIEPKHPMIIISRYQLPSTTKQVQTNDFACIIRLAESLG